MEESNDYVSAIKTQDFPSKGRVSRVKSGTTGRLHHLLSDLETNVFYLLDFEESVIDIKEHYPLLDLFDDEVDLENINLNKFKNKETNEQYMFTTTFVVTIKNENKECYLALAVKNENQLYKSTTLEKLEVERRYWKSKGIKWHIITNKDISIEKVENIKWLLLSYSNESIEQEDLIIKLIEDTIQGNTNVKISTLMNNISKVLNIGEELVLAVFKKLIIERILNTDLNKKIRLSDELERFKLKDGEYFERCINS